MLWSSDKNLQFQKEMAAGVHHIRVLVSSPGQLVARCGDLVTRVSAAPASAARVLVSLQPSLLAQLRPDTLDTWVVPQID